MPSFESYVFDFGNTFVDLRSGYMSTFSTVFGQFGMPYDPSKVCEYADTPLDQLFSRYHTGCVCEFRDFVSMTLAVYERNMRTSARLYADSVPCLAFLKACGCKLGIVSCSYEEHIRKILSEFDLEDAFTSIVGQDRAVLQRPNPYSISLCMREMDADPRSTLVVSSSPLDIETGRNAGIATALLDRDGSLGTSCGPDYYISSLTQLTDL